MVGVTNSKGKSLWILQLFVSLLHQPNCKWHKTPRVTLLQGSPGYKGKAPCLVCQTWKICQLLHHIAVLSLPRNVLTVTVCLSEASAYLTGGDVTIFMLHALIGFLVKYSMVFLRFFFLLLGVYYFWLQIVAQLQNSKVLLFSVMQRDNFEAKNALKHRQFFVPSFVLVACFVLLKSLSPPSFQSAVP